MTARADKGHRHCRRCDQTKPIADYSRAPNGDLRDRCDQCRSESAERTRRQCTRCGETKPSTQFGHTASGDLRTRCKQCVAELDAITSPAFVEQLDLRNGWTALGACVGLPPSMFFPEPGQSIDEAIATCQSCPVRLRCLDHALTRPEPEGIWGGTSARTRERMQSNRDCRKGNTAA